VFVVAPSMLAIDVYFYYECRDARRLCERHRISGLFARVGATSLDNGMLFDEAYLLRRWLAEAPAEDIARLRKVEARLQRVRTHTSSGNARRKRRVYERLTNSQESLLDWAVAKAANGDRHRLRDLVHSLTNHKVGTSRAQADGSDASGTGADVLVKQLFRPACIGELVQWLEESADEADVQNLAAFVASIKRFAALRQQHSLTLLAGQERSQLGSAVGAAMHYSGRTRAAVAPDDDKVGDRPGAANASRMSWRARKFAVMFAVKSSEDVIEHNALESQLERLVDLSQALALQLIPVEVAPSAGPGGVASWKPIPQVCRCNDAINESDLDLMWTCESGTPSGLCIESKAVVKVDNVLTDERFVRDERRKWWQELSQLHVPLLHPSANGVVVGVLRLLNKTSIDGQSAGVPFDVLDEHEAVACGENLVELHLSSCRASASDLIARLLPKAASEATAERAPLQRNDNNLTDMVTPVHDRVRDE